MVVNKTIIDGIDVSKCKYLTGVVNEEPYCSDVGESYQTYLCRNKECLYKDYKRKEQECDRLDNECQNLFTEKTNLEIELNQLKKENKQYFEILNSSCLHNLILETEKKVLIQSLKEIKEILEQYLYSDKRKDKELDVDFYLSAMHKWLNKCEVIDDSKTTNE